MRPSRVLWALLGALPALPAPGLAQAWAPPGYAGPGSGGSPSLPAPAVQAQAPVRVRAVNAGLVEMAVRRLPDAVEIEISGVGAGPQLLQTTRGSSWEGRLLVATPTTLRRGPQRFSLPEAGLQSISIDGAGSRFALMVTPLPGYPVGRPVVSADGSNLILSFAAAPQPTQQSFGRDLSVPGRVPQPDLVPPLQSRAVAPPVGDMAVGSMMIANSGFVNVSGPPVSMTLSNAPVQNVLMLLARLGGYGLVFVNDQSGTSSQASGGSTPQAATSSTSAAPQNRRISIAFRNESYGRAVNSSLMAAGLQGKIEGNTLLVGPNVLGKGFGAQLSKVYRLNQVGANSAADYLANLGARVSKTNTTTTAISQGVPQSQQVNQGSTTNTTQSSTTTTVDSYGSDTGPLLGLQATTDSRLSTITLVGSPALVAVAETYLRQLDLRQRQVALSVKILDVTLDNDSAISNSFAFRYGNNFIVNDQGKLVGAFGSFVPNPGLPSDPPTPSTFYAPGLSAPLIGVQQAPPLPNPGLQFPRNNFYDFVQASIQSQSTKLLASPTLILSENQDELKGGAETAATLQTAGGTGGGSSSGSGGSTVGVATIGRPRANESFLTVGEQVITNYEVTSGTQGNGNSCQPQFGIAGLTFGARVSKIDDNGFVTFSLSPQVSATTNKQNVPGCGPIDILAIRRLDTGSARVRDGQTLILTGVISDADTQAVSKWPILGDIPLIGQFFRDSTGSRRKRELVIMVTPRIIDDTQGGTWGYGFQPSSRDTRRFLGTSSGQSPY
jgi:type IV pilus assembly protein PilQ